MEVHATVSSVQWWGGRRSPRRLLVRISIECRRPRLVGRRVSRRVRACRAPLVVIAPGILLLVEAVVRVLRLPLVQVAGV